MQRFQTRGFCTLAKKPRVFVVYEKIFFLFPTIPAFFFSRVDGGRGGEVSVGWAQSISLVMCENQLGPFFGGWKGGGDKNVARQCFVCVFFLESSLVKNIGI